jgi:hypothetical protein
MHEQLIDLADGARGNQHWFTAKLYGVYFLQKQTTYNSIQYVIEMR